MKPKFHPHDHKCPECQADMNAVCALHGDQHAPKPGDVSVCDKCGAKLRFSDDLTPRSLTKEDEADLNADSVSTMKQLNAVSATIKNRGLPKRPLPEKLHEMREIAIQQYRDLFLSDGTESPPVLFLYQMVGEEIAHEYVREVGEFHGNDAGKMMLSVIMDGIENDPDAPFNAFIYMSESWTLELRRKDGESPQDFHARCEAVKSPLDSEDCIEALVVTTRMAGREGEVKMFTIDREAKVLTPRDTPKGATLGGRFSGLSYPLDGPDLEMSFSSSEVQS